MHAFGVHCLSVSCCLLNGMTCWAGTLVWCKIALYIRQGPCYLNGNFGKKDYGSQRQSKFASQVAGASTLHGCMVPTSSANWFWPLLVFSLFSITMYCKRSHFKNREKIVFSIFKMTRNAYMKSAWKWNHDVCTYNVSDLFSVNSINTTQKDTECKSRHASCLSSELNNEIII